MDQIAIDNNDNNDLKNFKKKKIIISPRDKLIENIKILFKLKNIEWNNDLINDIPKKWKIFDDLVLLPFNCFLNDIWTKFDIKNLLWKIVAESLKVERVAKENRIQNDDYRTPNIEILLGSNTWVFTIDNGIKYSFDIIKCMFSSGNITEKIRIANFNCKNETVVDLYAGIGYFTLPYIIHAKANKVIACEWNPSAIEALKKNLILNNCVDKCEIFEGDNRLSCPSNCADRVNLGLIPSSEESWPVACRALKSKTGGYLHIHGNVDLNSNEKNKSKIKQEWIDWANYSKNKINLLLINLNISSQLVKWNVQIENIEYVKSYGPRVDHLVLDLHCIPEINS